MKKNRHGLNRTLGIAIGVIVLIAMIGSGGALMTLSQLRDATTSRYRSAQIISSLDAFRTAMLNQETGVRGYLLTGRPASLEPYHSGRAALDRSIHDLRVLIGPGTQNGYALSAAEQAARQWQAEIGSTVVRLMENPTSRDRARLLEATGAGKARFDLFRARLQTIERAERASLVRENLRVDRAQRAASITLWGALLATLFMCVGVAIAINRLIAKPLVALADTMHRLVERDTSVIVPEVDRRNEVGAMARAVEVFKNSLIELDRTSVLRVTADTMPAMIAYIDRSERVGFLNEEFGRWFDLGVDDVSHVYGRALPDVFPGGSFPGAASELKAALAGEERRFAFQREVDGQLRDFEAYLKPHMSVGGTLLGVVVLLTDVTDRKEIDRQLRHQAHDLQRSNAELEQFAYVASHDLKAPLRGIENLASWIEEDLGDKLDGDTRTNMNLLKSRVRRLESLLSDLLAYSRAGRDDTGIREVDTRALVYDLAALISPPEGIRIEADPALPTIRAPQAALTQTLQNLIGNAVKHHPDPAHGIIEIKAERHGDHYEFQVRDNGAGIPEQFRERVFGMFQTLKPRDEVEGSGMGLTIVRKIVERQSGNVWLSDGEAGGLVVHFTWPVVPKEA